MDKKALSESDICDRYITPAVERAGWATEQWRREFGFTDGKMIVRGKLVARGKRKRADYLLFHKPNLPIAVIEAKDNNHSVRAGMQQALDYAETARRAVRVLLERRRVRAPRQDRHLSGDRDEPHARRVPHPRRAVAPLQASGGASTTTSRSSSPPEPQRDRRQGSLATTSSSRSTARSRPSPRARSGSCS